MNKIKNIALIVLAIVAAIAIVLLVQKSNELELAKSTVKSGQQVVKQAATVIERYQDSAGRNHAQIRANENVLPVNWYKNGTAISGGLIDTVATALNIARKQLVEVTQIATVSQARALKAERKVDSLKRVTYLYKSKYLDVAYRPAPAGADSTDNGEFDYSYRDSLTVTQYWKKKWFLGAKKSYIDIYSQDPRTRINGVSRLVVEQKEPVFGLRVQAVSNYSFSRKLLNVGPGLQFDIKKFSLVGTYYYDFDAGRFRPSVGARYDLIRF